MTFIVIAGTDGSGKATQATILEERLIEECYKTKLTDFPRYDKPHSKFVIEYLNGLYGSARDIGPYAGSIFYAYDRYQNAPEIRQWLEEGYIVISNRYVSANKGHQTGKIKDPKKRDEFLDWLNDLEYNFFGIPKEDLNILLYVPPETGQQLVDKKGQRTYTNKKRDLHEADLDHLKEAADAYLYVAKKDGWVIINCTKDGQILPKEEIHEKIYNTIKPLILK